MKRVSAGRAESKSGLGNESRCLVRLTQRAQVMRSDLSISAATESLRLRRWVPSTGGKRLNISPRHDHPLLAAQKREQYIDPLMWFHFRVTRHVPSKWAA